jgi:ComF family protein
MGIILPYFIDKSIQYLNNSCSFMVAKHCLFCLEKTQNSLDLCTACMNQLAVNDYHCIQCATPLMNDSLSNTKTTHCGRCLSQSHSLYYDQVYAPLLYSTEMSYLIKQMKYQKKIYLAQVLCQLFIHHKQINTFTPELLIPIPMHPRRLRQRGFNQALELGRILASYYQLPINYEHFIRHRYTRLQVSMNAHERQKNLDQAFLLKKPITYQHVVLIDDVMTTGSTVNEAAKTLKKNGIQRVDVWIMARAG